MNPLLLAVIVLYPLLQVPAVIYLSRYCEVEGPLRRMREFGDDDDGCPRCGSVNDPGYAYCRRCAARLR